MRLWNQFAVKLSGFDKDYKRFLLTIDFQDIVVTGGDRLWIDLGTADKTEVLIGDKKNTAELFVSSVDSYQAVDAYAAKRRLITTQTVLNHLSMCSIGIGEKTSLMTLND